MAENYLTDPNKKANSKYSRLLNACRELDEFDVCSVSVLEQALQRLETDETLDAQKSFDMLFQQTDMLKALAFLFANLKLNEESDYNDEVKSGIVSMLEGIAGNIERLVISFADKKRIMAIKL